MEYYVLEEREKLLYPFLMLCLGTASERWEGFQYSSLLKGALFSVDRRETGALRWENSSSAATNQTVAIHRWPHSSTLSLNEAGPILSGFYAKKNPPVCILLRCLTEKGRLDPNLFFSVDGTANPLQTQVGSNGHHGL